MLLSTAIYLRLDKEDINEAAWIVNISADNIPILLFEFKAFNMHTTTSKWQRICCCGTYETRVNALKASTCLRAESSMWSEHLFRTILKWFRRKNNLCGLRTTNKAKQRNKLILPNNIYLVAFHTKRKYSLTLDNFSLSSQQLVPNHFLYPSKSSDAHLQNILAQFWPNDSPPF